MLSDDITAFLDPLDPAKTTVPLGLTKSIAGPTESAELVTSITTSAINPSVIS